MSNASRQKTLRQKRKEEGLVDIRLDVPVALRDKLKVYSYQRNQSMKCVIIQAIERYIT